MAEPLVREPGTQVEYSDLGFILLGEIVERLTGEPLDEFAQREIFAPLGNEAIPCSIRRRSLRARIAPTENDPTYRKRLIQGEVHDENAWAMGGVAGHAGLFSTAGDIAAFAQMLLNGGIYAHQRLLARSTIQQFTARQTIGDSARALGWDVPVAAFLFRPIFLGAAASATPASPALRSGSIPEREPFRHPADQSREPHPRERQNPPGAARAARRRLRSAGPGDRNAGRRPITSSAQSRAESQLARTRVCPPLPL